MAVQGQELVFENLRKQLAVAVRSIQWSYAIFWSLSTTQQGVLEWGEGYYNGDIKTRKTVQAVELKPDKIGLLRSEQLRELYKSLLDGDIDQQAKRPSAALSPEDLTDEEWYYLVCMSFVFNCGQGLPGRVLEDGQTIWLCNAHYADSKVFSRSLLAKSASIQTVLCFRHLGGVIELGVTELVPEDLGLIQHIKTSLLDFSKPVCAENGLSVPHGTDDDKEPVYAKVSTVKAHKSDFDCLCRPGESAKFDQNGISDIVEDMDEAYTLDSPDDCSQGCDHDHQTEDSFMPELNDGSSLAHSWQNVDVELNNRLQNPLNSSDCISDGLNQARALVSPKVDNVHNLQLKKLQGNDTKLTSLDTGAEKDLHYIKVLSDILGSSKELIGNSCFRSAYRSNFVPWKQGVANFPKPLVQQNVLKKILFAVPLMHDGRSYKSTRETERNGKWLEDKESCKPHILSDKQEENEKFLILRSMVSSISEIDKALILDDIINYLKELEARVEELEAFMDIEDSEGWPRKGMEMVEQTSDNYENKIDNGNKTWMNKRKASDIYETNTEFNGNGSKDGLTFDVKVNVKEKEVLIEMSCPYREYILLDIMDAINSLHLDAHTVQSSTLDGILTLTLKSKFRGAAIASAGMIKQALWKITSTC